MLTARSTEYNWYWDWTHFGGDGRDMSEDGRDLSGDGRDLSGDGRDLSGDGRVMYLHNIVKIVKG